MSPADPPAARVRGLEKAYGDRPVLRGIDLDVPLGGATAVLGPSGCGKTTLLRIVAGLVRADAGRVEIAGELTDDPRSRVPPERRGVALVFQDLALWPHMSVRQNLAFVLEPRGVPRAEREPRVRAAAAAVGLPERLLDESPGQLSGGERQRAALARALAQEPRLVLLDEPLSNLDRDLRVQMLALFRRLQQERGLSTLLVTHDREEAFALARRIVVLRHGRVEQEGTPEEIYARPRTRFVAEFVGTASLLPVERRDGRLVTPLGSFPGDAAPSGPLLAVVRPEDVRFAPDGPVRGVLVDSVYRGDHWLHTVEVPAGTAPRRLLVRTPRRAPAEGPVALETEAPAFVPADEPPGEAR